MINFFRKKRKLLADENKSLKYARYAIGEIVLVVIGILIALQINNWNNNRLEIKEEKNLLADLQSEFKKNDSLLENYDIIRIDKVLKSHKILINYGLKSRQIPKTENIDSILFRAMAHPTWNPSLMVLDDLKNSGRLSKIKNEKLKQHLYNWYSFYTDYLEDIKGSEKAHGDLNFYSINKGYYYTSAKNYKLPPEDKKAIYLNDTIFISFLMNYNRMAKKRKREYLDAQRLIKNIIKETTK